MTALRLHELEHRMVLLEQVVIGQRQTIDLLMNLQRIQQSVTTSLTPSTTVPASSGFPVSSSSALSERDHAALSSENDRYANDTSSGDKRSEQKYEKYEKDEMIGGDGTSQRQDDEDDDTTSASAALFLHRSRWAV